LASEDAEESKAFDLDSVRQQDELPSERRAAADAVALARLAADAWADPELAAAEQDPRVAVAAALSKTGQESA
jgi:hypothetical protein